MATSTKKKTGAGAKKTQSGGKKPVQSKKKSPQSQAAGIWERVTAGILCVLFALFGVLAAFHVEAIFIDLFATGVRGLLGYGFWLITPALLLVAYLLLFRQKEKVALRILCAFLLPVLLACLLHVILAKGEYALDLTGLKGLWADGQIFASGGALSGIVAEVLSRLFSKIGAFFILLLGLALVVLSAFHITPETIAKAVRNTYFHRSKGYEDYEDDDEDYGDEAPEPYREEPVPVTRGSKRNPLDLPLDERTGEILEEPKKHHGLFRRESKVKRPDEVVQELKQGKPVQPDPEEAIPAPVEKPANPPFVAPDPEPVTSLLEPEELPLEPEAPLVEKELTKSEKKEIIREHQESVARDASSNLEVVHAYQYPSIELLQAGAETASGAVEEELAGIQKRLSDTILSFGIEARIVGAVRGPSITRYEVELEQGVRLNRLTNLADDIALALGASSVRIAPVPGKISLVGIEVPNQVITAVKIREVLSSEEFTGHKSKVSFAVGKDIGGNYIIGDAARLPHLLIAGTTGSGKSVCTNSLIISMLYKAAPEEVRLIMIDPKMVELGIYNGIPHLLIPVVTDPKKAAGALQWAVTEMMKRYRMFSEVGVRELASYNSYAEKQEELQKLPQIVIVIDELADLMLVAAKEVEESICRVAQMGRAAGMHLIIATQRPSADVITGLMKANIPSRIAFAVASSLESRIILDTQGADKLVGKGDMLWFPLGAGKPLRVQGCLIDDAEVSSVVSFIKESSSTDYDEAVLQEIEQHAAETGKGSKGQNGATAISTGEEEGYDDLLPAAVDIVLELGQASVSMLQRRLKLGYARAARLVDQMEDRGIVGPFEGSKPRQLLVTKEQWAAMHAGVPVPEEIEEELVLEVDAVERSQEETLPPWEGAEEE